MYRIRIEHTGYDESPLTFNTTISLAEYLASIARSKELKGKVTFTLQLIEGNNNE